MMMRVPVLLLVSGAACGANRGPDTAALALAHPGPVPQLVGPGVISTGDDECHPTLSPDGKTLYFLKDAPSFDFYTIVYSERAGAGWTRPEVAPFSGQYADADLTITADGRHAYFVSMRPLEPGGRPREDTEIWTVDRDDAGLWGTPRHVDELSSPGDEWFPTVTADGTLYFGSVRPGGLGGSDIWRARWDGHRFAAPENLGSPVNSAADEVEAFIAPDESFLIMSASRRPDSLGSYDLYVARRSGAGWGEPEHLPAPVNSPGWDFGPRLSPDGKVFLFTSSRRIGNEPLDHPLSYDELETRLHRPGNGLRDIYAVDASVLHLAITARGER